MVSMNLVDGAGVAVRVTFPDVPGEAYRRMWEDRDCDPTVAEILKAESVLLFVHADTIRRPGWVVDEVKLAKEMGIEITKDEPVHWHPRFAPTQVQLVDVLQMMRQSPIDIGPRRLAIMLSAWDKVQDEELLPKEFLDAKMPLLSQYLRQAADGWIYRVYGVSAQGGDYDRAEDGAQKVPAADDIRKLDSASTRINLVGPGVETHDLTEPISWLMN